MSAGEIAAVAFALALAFSYLLHRAWRWWSGRGGGCAACPVARPKIRLAGRPPGASSDSK